jgi:hypothetical protein
MHHFRGKNQKKPISLPRRQCASLLNHIDVEYCDTYDSWLRIGAALFNSGFSKSVFDVFSRRSHDRYMTSSGQAERN